MNFAGVWITPSLSLSLSQSLFLSLLLDNVMSKEDLSLSLSFSFYSFRMDKERKLMAVKSEDDKVEVG